MPPKKPATKTSAAGVEAPKAVEKKAPVAAAPAEPKPTVIGPGVMKRPKRDPSLPPPPDENLPYVPSAQVFRRK